jgi:two-component system OmpR family sensor kinase/two-component system sensor histidine kinase BaeS
VNRLWVRLTFAFVAVTLVGVATVALLTDWSAGREFRRFLAQQDVTAQDGLVDDLAAFYRRNKTWEGVSDVFAAQPTVSATGRGMGAMRGRPGFLLADASGLVVYDERNTRVGTSITAGERAGGIPISDSRQHIVGYLLATGGPGRGQMQQAEQNFLDELRQTLMIAALAAGGLGILMGLVISRMVAAPLSGLALAARAFAARDWDRRVQVRGADEIADVAREFNEMADTVQREQALRRNLTADVAHELRSPLAVLQGNLRAMLDGVYPLELAEIGTLYDQTRLLNRLVDDLRELALVDAGQLPLNLQPVDLGKLCRTAAGDFQAAAEAKTIRLVADIAEDYAACVRGDPDRISQVLRNLLGNALRHTPPDGAITISMQANSENEIRVSVVDTGEGMAPEDIPHVFDRFYRADKSRSREGGGTGLGLAIAKAWVEAMGGTIRVESEPGRGSCFSFILPACSRDE